MNKLQSSYILEQVGTPGRLDFRLFLKSNGSPISIWHDIPLYAEEGKFVNMVVEIPRWTNAKFEVSLIFWKLVDIYRKDF